MTGRNAGASQGSSHHIGKKVVSEDSVVSQLKKALQSMHMNQRVQDIKIKFKRHGNKPVVSIDGIECDNPESIETIQVSRVLKYQQQEVDRNDIVKRLREGIQKHDSELLKEPDAELNFETTYKLMQSILSSQLTSEQYADVRMWFRELGTPGAGGHKRLKADVEGPLADLFERCQRKRSQLSLPIQTFLPLKTS